jgi:hypothetical protein
MDEDLTQTNETPGDDLDTAAAAFTAHLSGEGAAASDDAVQPVAAAPAPVTPAAAPEPVVTTAATAPPQAAPVTPAAPAAPTPPATGKEPTASEASTQIQSTLNFAKAMTAQLQTQLMGEFEDIKSDADVYKLMGEDPGRYNRFAIAVTKIQAAQNQVGQLETQARTAAEAAQKEWDAAKGQRLEATRAKLRELIPELADKEKGIKLSADITQYAAKNEISPERAGDYTANEVVILHKAMQFDAMKAAEAANLEAATKKAAKAPPVQEPGARTAKDGKEDRDQANWTKFKNSGRIDDAGRVFQSILGG